MAYANPELLKQAISENPDGTVTVTFRRRSERIPVTLDADLPSLDLPILDRVPLYGSSTSVTELWPALVEKAYAQLNGGYEAIGNGGWMAPALEALTGRRSESLPLKNLDPARVAARISELASAGKAVTASTIADPPLGDLVPRHAYTVCRAEQRNGEWWVQVRNPWASAEVGRD